MLNKKFFNQILNDYQSYYRLREEGQKISRAALRNSKQAIFSLHRDDIKEAKKILDGTESLFLNLEKLFVNQKKLQYEGFFCEAAEEFIEAKMFYEFLTENKIDFKSRINFSTNNYLGGVCDFTGEIVRKSIQLATAGKFKEIESFKKICEEILGELTKFDLVGKLRLKYDEAKRNLKRMEEILYEIKMRQRG
ncbi:MAG: hypothetical protein AB1465_03205 [Patescibacteria group bacterium]